MSLFHGLSAGKIPIFSAPAFDAVQVFDCCRALEVPFFVQSENINEEIVRPIVRTMYVNKKGGFIGLICTSETRIIPPGRFISFPPSLLPQQDLLTPPALVMTLSVPPPFYLVIPSPYLPGDFVSS